MRSRLERTPENTNNTRPLRGEGQAPPGLWPAPSHNPRSGPRREKDSAKDAEGGGYGVRALNRRKSQGGSTVMRPLRPSPAAGTARSPFGVAHCLRPERPWLPSRLAGAGDAPACRTPLAYGLTRERPKAARSAIESANGFWTPETDCPAAVTSCTAPQSGSISTVSRPMGCNVRTSGFR